jgi:hypothetical protein
MRVEQFSSLAIYFDDEEIPALHKLSETLKSEAFKIGLKKVFSEDEKDLIEKLYEMFDHADNGQCVTRHQGDLIETKSKK